MYTVQGQKLASLSTPLGLSYFCSTRQELPLDTGSLRLEHTQFEVFHKAPLKGDGTDFGSSKLIIVTVKFMELVLTTKSLVHSVQRAGRSTAEDVCQISD